jgi:GTPase SAR1 family protein
MLSTDPRTAPVAQLQQALDLGSEIVERFAFCRSALGQDEITIAILGRFKAGKSSFINHFIGRSILPVGVVPVTTVVTEIRFGPTETLPQGQIQRPRMPDQAALPVTHKGEEFGQPSALQ